MAARKRTEEEGQGGAFLGAPDIFSLEYRYKNTTQVTIRNTISNLLSSQLNKQMMANAKENYLIEVIESPLIAEIKSSPNRSLIVLNSTMIGFLLAIIFYIFLYLRKNYINKEKTSS